MFSHLCSSSRTSSCLTQPFDHSPSWKNSDTRPSFCTYFWPFPQPRFPQALDGGSSLISICITKPFQWRSSKAPGKVATTATAKGSKQKPIGIAVEYQCCDLEEKKKWKAYRFTEGQVPPKIFAPNLTTTALVVVTEKQNPKVSDAKGCTAQGESWVHRQ